MAKAVHKFNLAHELEAVVFTEEMLPQVQDFNCGDRVWERFAAEWIKLPLPYHGAIHSMKRHGTTVWLFYLGESLVGFGSLGVTTWKWPALSDEKRQVGYIPQLAICKDFQGQPAGPRENRFSYQIMGHILAEAKGRGHSVVGLVVDAENVGAQRFYANVGFVSISERAVHERTFIQMAILI